MNTFVLLLASFIANPVISIRPANRPDIPPATGVVVSKLPGGKAAFLTAAHVCEWSDLRFGENQVTVLAIDKWSDLALASVSGWQGEPAELADSEPAKGSLLRSTGSTTGQASGQYKGKSRETGRMLAGFKSRIGDSGGAIWNTEARLVGIITCGEMYSQPGDRRIEYTAGPSVTEIKKFLTSHGWQCNNGRCRPVARQAAGAWRPGTSTGSSFVPSAGKPIAPGGSGTTEPASLSIDYERLANMVAARIKVEPGPPGKQGPKGDQGERGVQGAAGPAGPPGEAAKVDLEELTAAVISAMEPLTVEIVDENGRVIEYRDKDGILRQMRDRTPASGGTITLKLIPVK